MIAVNSPVIGATREIRQQMLGGHLASLLRSDAQYCGTLYTGTGVWVIGSGRPVFLRPLQENQRLADWYEKMNAPVGPDREFWSVTIDWRGAPQEFSQPGDMFVIPEAARVIHGDYQWPDGNAQEMQTRVAEAGGNKVLSDAASNLTDTYRFVSASLPSPGTTLALAAFGAGLAATTYLLLRRRMR